MSDPQQPGPQWPLTGPGHGRPPYEPPPGEWPPHPHSAQYPVAGFPRRRQNLAVLCLVLGIAGTAAGLILPRLSGAFTTSNGSYSVDGFRSLCSSGFGELAQTASKAAASNCSSADTYGGVLLALLIAGLAVLLAGVLLLTRGRRPA